ncbi:MAG: type I glyceraldehyde-3-phosphate dehydrogenase, partial [Pseudolabrys sp.]|nr:type I glyceraldehyde-3-phosphate dehydrogenase [Pseudolabrys sp.]
DFDVVAINDLGDPKALAMLFKYDSVQGRFPGGDVRADGDSLVVNGKKIKVVAEKDPRKLPWKALGVDICLESTGFFTEEATADKPGYDSHLEAGAKKVVISAPSKGKAKTIVLGVNDSTLTKGDTCISNASCTTNCLAPMAKVLHETFGIEKGLMTTVHAYTNDQRVSDQIHKDPHRARAAALNIIPTSTGAATAVGLVLPDLKGKLDGVSVRVPTPNVSLVDLKFVARRATSAAEINDAIKAAAAGPLKGILDVVHEKLVSVDFNHNPASSSFALDQTKVMDGTLVRVMSWYDNEWGFSNRMADTAVAMGKLV